MISLSLNDWLVNILRLISKYDLDDGEFLIAKLVIKYIKIELISLMNQRFKQIKIKYKGLTFKMYPSLEEIIKNNIKNNSGFDVICY